jgi:hypothetical protein
MTVAIKKYNKTVSTECAICYEDLYPGDIIIQCALCRDKCKEEYSIYTHYSCYTKTNRCCIFCRNKLYHISRNKKRTEKRKGFKEKICARIKIFLILLYLLIIHQANKSIPFLIGINFLNYLILKINMNFLCISFILLSVIYVDISIEIFVYNSILYYNLYQKTLIMKIYKIGYK